MPSEEPVIPPLPRGVSKAVRVRDLLRELILAGRFVDGLLPSEQELMLQYAASRATVRGALQLLRAERLIERRQGTGTFVVRRKSFHSFDHVHGIAQAALSVSRRMHAVVALEVVPAPLPVADFLGVPPGGACVCVEFVTSLGGERFSVSVSYLPTRLADRLPPGGFEGDFYEYLEAAGASVGSGDLMVEAVTADAHTAVQLELPTGAGVMLFRRRLFGPGGAPLELGFIRCRGDQLALVTRLPRRPGGPTC